MVNEVTQFIVYQLIKMAGLEGVEVKKEPSMMMWMGGSESVYRIGKKTFVMGLGNNYVITTPGNSRIARTLYDFYGLDKTTNNYLIVHEKEDGVNFYEFEVSTKTFFPLGGEPLRKGDNKWTCFNTDKGYLCTDGMIMVSENFDATRVKKANTVCNVWRYRGEFPKELFAKSVMTSLIPRPALGNGLVNYSFEPFPADGLFIKEGFETPEELKLMFDKYCFRDVDNETIDDLSGFIFDYNGEAIWCYDGEKIWAKDFLNGVIDFETVPSVFPTKGRVPCSAYNKCISFIGVPVAIDWDTMEIIAFFDRPIRYKLAKLNVFPRSY